MEVIYTILIVMIVLIALYYILSYIFQKSTQLTSLKSGTLSQTISSSKLPNSNNSSNYAFSTWFYVDDWNYRYSETKVLLDREASGSSPNDTGVGACPKIYLGPRENDIYIEVATFSQNDGTPQDTHVSQVRNFPLQKWVNLIISLYGRTLDIYIDGKLVQSDILSGVAKPCTDADVKVTPNGGFQGYTSNFKYWSHAVNPQEAYNIYKDGFGGGSLGNIFNKYRVKVAFLEDNKEEASFEI